MDKYSSVKAFLVEDFIFVSYVKCLLINIDFVFLCEYLIDAKI